MPEVQSGDYFGQVRHLGDLQPFQALLRNRLLDDRYVENRFLPLTRSDRDFLELRTTGSFSNLDPGLRMRAARRTQCSQWYADHQRYAQPERTLS